VEAKKNSKDAILETAMRLLQLQGYHATGLNQIIKESGAPKGSLYYHFPQGKEQLAVEAVNRMAEKITGMISADLNKCDDAVEAYQYHLNEIANSFENMEEFSGIHIGPIAAETALISEPLRHACMQAIQHWVGLSRKKLLDCGYDEKDAAMLSVVISALIEGAISYALTHKNGEVLRTVADFVPTLLKK